VDNANYPYQFDERTTSDYLAEKNAAHPGRLDDALKIVTDNNYCIKCHLIGDWNPVASERDQGPAPRPGVQAAAARVPLALARQSQAVAPLHGHAGQRAARQAGQPGALSRHE